MCGSEVEMKEKWVEYPLWAWGFSGCEQVLLVSVIALGEGGHPVYRGRKSVLP